MRTFCAFFITLACVGYLSGCGGSSGTQTPALPASPPNLSPTPSTGDTSPIVEGDSAFIFGQTEAFVGDAIGYGIIAKSDALSVQWEQTSGPVLTILANNSQGIGFDLETAGQYTLVANIQQNNGQTERLTIDLSVSELETSEVQVRLDHAVTELGKVSLHAQSTRSKTISNIEWSQVAGPPIQQAQFQDAFAFFNAPSVERDVIIVMRADVQFSDGTSASDDAIITVVNVAFDTNGLFYTNDFIITPDMHAYNPDSPWKNAIESCVYNNQIPNRPSCNFNELPLIGTQNNSPTVQDILDRTLISHTWMGDKFKAYLENSAAGPDMLLLLRGVTAVVISYDVRPSFYWVATGAIYLDARNFWESPQERDTLNDQPDFRSDFGNELGFSIFWRYTKDNQYYPNGNYPQESRETRTFTDVEASISWLMYHELAHANDFFPPNSWQSVDMNTTPLDYFQSNGANSDELAYLYPIRSDEMHALAEVRFGGETPTSVQRNYRGTDVEAFFTPDIAPSFYAYYTIREDYATLVERFLMLYRLNAEADLAIIDGETNSDFNVVWGQRNRISEPALAERTAFAVARVYPELGRIATLQQQMPGARLMEPANGWFGNLNLSPSSEGRMPNLLPNFDMKQRAILDQRHPHEDKPTVSKD
jgi:hypothetical protein